MEVSQQAAQNALRSAQSTDENAAELVIPVTWKPGDIVKTE
jgi:hypothetical protein